MKKEYDFSKGKRGPVIAQRRDTVIDQALILAAGHGSRLRDHVPVTHKALVQIEGEPLLVRTCRMLEQSGLREVVVVTGHCGADVCAALNGASGLGIGLRFVENPQWKLSNGISVLAATGMLSEKFLLLMADHLFDPAMIAAMRGVSLSPGEVVLAVDRKLDAIYDMDDATKVRLEGERIAAIGKELTDFNAVDTGPVRLQRRVGGVPERSGSASGRLQLDRWDADADRAGSVARFGYWRGLVAGCGYAWGVGARDAVAAGARALG